MEVDDNDDDEMFKPPNMDDDEYPSFGRKGGLFSGGKGLFDDEEVSVRTLHTDMFGYFLNA